MEIKIFYSWQSDLPNNTNRGFIQTALDKAVKNIRNDESIKVEPRTDKDTQGVGGSPAIPETILEKIDGADIFVCDVSIINNGSKFRLAPNPNVLFELGYALKTLTWDRVIMVCNQAFGNISKLPFDLPTRRIIPYFVSEKDEDKSIERRKLEIVLENHIRTITNNNASLSIPVRQIKIDVSYNLVQAYDGLEIYRLTISLTNIGNKPISNYRFEIEFPRVYLNDSTLVDFEEVDKITEQYRFFRITSEHRQNEPLYPDDKRIIFSPSYEYSGRNPYNDILKIKVYIDEQLVRNIEKPMSELLNK